MKAYNTPSWSEEIDRAEVESKDEDIYNDVNMNRFLQSWLYKLCKGWPTEIPSPSMFLSRHTIVGKLLLPTNSVNTLKIWLIKLSLFTNTG